ncbi:hypothetical protein AALH30_24900 [Blautia pseudococcoides]|uniref:hypothetical protein n=1 Tax=Blautia pseudococcoides TaxID=1796616 RepID=UPI00148B1A3A|nr:hypothetical protein [Blautia pseudococcoides]QJU14792.1 hypothetical protein HL650_10190 [Blautia pseudococcoides]
MWYGKMTEELKKLYDEYERKFGNDPSGYMEVEYGQKHYKDYVRDIKTALRTGKELPDVMD